MSQSDPDVSSQCIGDNQQGQRPPGQAAHLISGGMVGPYTTYDNLSSSSLTTPPFPPSFSSLTCPPASTSSGSSYTSVALTEDPNPANTASGTQRAPWRVGAPVPQTDQGSSQLARSAVPANPSEMRYIHPNLAILSAQEHTDGRRSKRPGPMTAPKAPNLVFSNYTPKQKKRGRKLADVDQDVPEEETKRTRGRPRLDSKDETAAERRRTQIRLAQRAYRNRKEGALTGLEAKVKNLTDVNKELGSAYEHLFDFASSRGLLAEAPEFGQQLQRLQALIKQTEDDDSLKGDTADPEGPSDDGRQTQPAEVTDTSPAASGSTESRVDQPQHAWGGLMGSHEPAIQQELSNSTSYIHFAASSRPAQYEVIAAPTHDNASFAQDMSFDANFMNPVPSNWATHPWNFLSGARSMAFNEWAFARRLHRETTEKALTLISMPNPPPSKMTSVFGFVMLFETVDQIRARTRATLDRIRDDPLNYWEYPFHRLGGSGTHFSAQGHRNPLEGLSAYQSTGYATGPFNERTTRVRDTLLGASQYINMDGWEGTWFDSGEVEMYLAQNGVVIPPTADFHTVEIQPGAFSDMQSEFQQVQLLQSIPPYATMNPNADLPLDPQISAPVPPSMGAASFTSSASSTHNITTATSAPENPWIPVSAPLPFMGATHTTDGGMPSFPAFDHTATMGFPNSSSYPYPPYGHIEPPAPNTKKVVLDVSAFITGLISHATCLGRSPAFRPRDIGKAFWEAVVTD
ncbi:hypothetical protein F5B20DRAFT_148004 [Whalleya microplaca]|nr:hypothetical protein F5B20DRAFT_148004 [Whalleya microplaca]